MIRTGTTGVFSFAARNAADLGRELANGSVVRLTVVASAPDGSLSVDIGGKVYTAVGPRGMSVGQSIDVRVRISDRALYLVPLNAIGSRPDPFSALGVPHTPVSAFLVSFFGRMDARLEGVGLRAIMRVASRFPGRELRAAEAAAILFERGIAIDGETVARFVAIMDGDPRGGGADETGGEAFSARDFCAFVNHKKGHERHWVVVPFSRALGGVAFTGSVRFLIDTATARALETRVTARETSRVWEFAIRDGSCSFTSVPELRPVVFDKCVVYLTGLLAGAGITDVRWHSLGEDPVSALKNIDLEI